jgi:rhodanese-related sulfurtransferase
MFFKLLYHKGSGQVLGAQAIGRGAADKRIDVIATLLRYRGTIMDLKDLELAYAPAFSTARDVVSQGALVACSVSDGLYDQVMFTQVRGLVEQGAYFVDVRTAGEFARAHIKGSVNIPLSHLRERLEEIPRDRPVYMLCRTGQRSYNAVRALKQRGWEQVYNVAGSFMALSWYEYYRDQTSGREPIVTAYEFE